MEKDYFNGAKTIIEVQAVKIQIEEKIHDEMPKYAKKRDFLNFDISTFDFEEMKNETSHLKEYRLKNEFFQYGMFGFVSWRWINPLVKWLGDKRCLEVMAGRGWLSKGLREKGKELIATDDYSWHRVENWQGNVTDVEELDAVLSVEKYGKDIDILIMSWPYTDNVAYQVIKKLHEINPDATVLFIGERWGCTGDDMFHEHFDIINDEQFYDKVASFYQSWNGFHDKMFLGKYSK